MGARIPARRRARPSGTHATPSQEAPLRRAVWATCTAPWPYASAFSTTITSAPAARAANRRTLWAMADRSTSSQVGRSGWTTVSDFQARSWRTRTSVVSDRVVHQALDHPLHAGDRAALDQHHGAGAEVRDDLGGRIPRGEGHGDPVVRSARPCGPRRPPRPRRSPGSPAGRRPGPPPGPTARWASSLAAPSSAMSPRTATRGRPGSRPRVARPAITDRGAAL